MSFFLISAPLLLHFSSILCEPQKTSDESVADLHLQADLWRGGLNSPAVHAYWVVRASLHTSAVVMGRCGGGVTQQGASGGKDCSNDIVWEL
jgi:hypothetical protein